MTTLAMAMAPGLSRRLFSPDQWRRLHELLDVTKDHSEAEVLLTSWGAPTLDEAYLRHSPGLRAVVHAAGTVKGFVTDAVWDRGIAVTSATAANAIPTAEFAAAMILLATKRTFLVRDRFRQERVIPAFDPTVGAYGRTVGIVGAGRVGRHVMRLLEPTDLRIVVSDPFHPDGVALDDLMAMSDVVSVHAPALLETHHLIDRRRLALMRDGATLVNTARGWCVDHEALTDELVSGRLHAVLDTTEPEPLPADSPLWELPNVVLTPHMAGSTGVELQRLAEVALEELARFVAGEPFAHAIERDELPYLA